MADALQLRVGGMIPFTATTTGVSNQTLDASTDALEFIFQAREGATITRVGFRYGSRTGTPPTYRVSLQGVDASGNPDGTIKGGASPASATFTPPADVTWDGTWQWVTLTNSYTCARGEYLALVIDYSAGTVDASNNGSFSYGDALGGGGGVPYAITNNAGVRTRQTARLIYGYGSASTAYGSPYETLGTSTINSGSTPDEMGVKFTLPAGWGSTFRLAGVRYMGAMAGGATLNLVLYDTDGTTVLQTVTHDTDHVSSSGNRNHELWFDEATLATLSFGSTYRVTLVPQSATAHSLFRLQLDSADDWAAHPGGTNFALTTRTDAGSWTDDTRTRPLMELILADITEPTGGPRSGGGMAGGING